MSLDTIKALRMAGKKPAGVVPVVVGELPKKQSISGVHVSLEDNPRDMDWRPLLGLWVAVYQAGDCPELTLKVVDSLEKVGAKLFGYASRFGVWPLVQDPKPEHEAALMREWEALCT